ncbi:MAG: phage major capsid protein [Egibacteraceae bacterium]
MGIQELQDELKAKRAKRDGLAEELQGVAEQLTTKSADAGLIERSKRLRAGVTKLDAEIGEKRGAWEAEVSRAYKAGELDGNLEAGTAGMTLPTTRGLKDRDRLGKGESVADWCKAKGVDDGSLASGVDPDEAWGAWFKGYVSGEWRDFKQMTKDMSSSPDSAGGFIVPTVLSARVIDLLRASNPIFQAGAQTVPMTSKTLDIARIGADVDATWHAEGAAITASDVTLERVRFTAKTLPVLCKASRELAEDAPNAGSVVAQSIAGATGVAVAKAALRGDGTGNAPTGIRNQTGVTVTELGAGNGDDADYDSFLDAIRDIALANAAAGAAILNPRTESSLNKRKASDGAYLTPPQAYSALGRFATTAIPTDLTVGTSTETTEAYVGDFTKLLIGMRAQLRIEPLRERFADSGQVAWLSWLRMDVQLEQPKAFVALTGITN